VNHYGAMHDCRSDLNLMGTYNLALGSGTLEIASGKKLLINGSGTGGVFNHSDGQCIVPTVRVGVDSGNTGTYDLSSQGTLDTDRVDVGRYGTGSFSQTGGTCDIQYNLTIGRSSTATGTYTLGGGTCTVGGYLAIGYEDGATGTLTIGAGTLTVTGDLIVDHGLVSSGTAALDIQDDAAVIEVGGDLVLGDRASFAVSDEDGAKITMTGTDSAFDIAKAVGGAAQVDGLGDLTLVFDREDDTDVKCLEVAGKDDDFGAIGTGSFNTANFVLDVLRVGKDSVSATYGPVRLELVDACDNQGDEEAEALFVNTLDIDDGGCFENDSLALYYLNGGAPKRFWRGDATLDGMVNYLDLGILASNYGKGTDGDGRGAGQDPPFPQDYDDDGDVDVDDLVIYLGILAGD